MVIRESAIMDASDREHLSSLRRTIVIVIVVSINVGVRPRLGAGD